MKRSLRFAVVALFILFCLSGCRKNHDVPADPGTLTATANGKTMTAGSCNLSWTGNFYSINGFWGDLSGISISIKTDDNIPTPLAVKTYVLDSARMYNTASYMPSALAYQAKSGTITITAIDQGKSATGSFNFIVDPNVVVSGTFLATVQ